jgi:predicted permease
MNRSVNVTIEGVERGAEDAARTDFRFADAGYFETMGIPLLRGRGIRTTDGPDSAAVAVVNQRFVERWMDSLEPLGRRIRIGEEERTIVGVVGNVRHSEIAAQPAPELYVPLAQSAPESMHFVVRTARDPSAIGPAIRREIASIDPAQPVAMMQTMEEMLRFAMPQQLAMKLVGAFAVLALVLAAVGLYGVLAHAVALRTKEIGVRMALGAGRGAVQRQVLGRGFRLVAIGLLLGSGAAFGAASLMRGLLYGVAPADPAAFAASIATLAGAALLACWIPARRATRVEPVVALREE